MASINSFVQKFLEEFNSTKLGVDPELCENIKQTILEAWKSQHVQDELQNIHGNKNTKRSPSAYVLYSNDHRAQVKQGLPDESKSTDVMRELARKWKLLTTSTDFADMQALADYRQKAKMQKTTSVPPKNSKKAEKKQKDVKVKRARNSYVLYCQEYRDIVKQSLPDGHKNADVMIELGKRWKALLESGDIVDIELLCKYKTMSQKEKEMLATADASAKSVKSYTEDLSECLQCGYHGNGGFCNNGGFYCDNCWIVFNGCEDELISRQNTQKQNVDAACEQEPSADETSEQGPSANDACKQEPSVDGACERKQSYKKSQKDKADQLIEELFGADD